MDGHVCNAVESIRVPCNFISGVLKLGFINTLKMHEKNVLNCIFLGRGLSPDFHGVHDPKMVQNCPLDIP